MLIPRLVCSECMKTTYDVRHFHASFRVHSCPSPIENSTPSRKDEKQNSLTYFSSLSTATAVIICQRALVNSVHSKYAFENERSKVDFDPSSASKSAARRYVQTTCIPYDAVGAILRSNKAGTVGLLSGSLCALYGRHCDHRFAESLCHVVIMMIPR